MVFLALKLKFQVFSIIVERSIGVVVQIEIHLGTHLSIHAKVNLLVKLKSRGLTVTFRKRRIVSELVVVTKLQFGTTLSLDTHTSRTKNLLGGTNIKLHVRKVKLILSFTNKKRIVPFFEVFLHRASFSPSHILVRGHQIRRTQEVVAQLRTNLIVAALFVILASLGSKVLRVSKVEGILFRTFVPRIVRLPNLLFRQRIFGNHRRRGHPHRIHSPFRHAKTIASTRNDTHTNRYQKDI